MIWHTIIRPPIVHWSRRMRALARNGLTLVELLITMTVLGVLAALLMPAVQSAREASRRTHCQANLRQIGIALFNYHESYDSFPIGCRDNRGLQIAWSAPLLGFLDEPGIWREFDPSAAFDSRVNRNAASKVVQTYLCPSAATSDERSGETSGDVLQNGVWDPGDDLAWIDYGGMFGVGNPKLPLGNGVMIYDIPVAVQQISDGLSRTIVVGEDSGRGLTMHGTWADGQNIFDQTGPVGRTRNNELFSDHPGGAHALFCDGSVHLLGNTVDLNMLFALCTRAGQD